VICTDKTGTLTENHMRVREFILGMKHYPVNAVGKFLDLDEHQRAFFLTAALCHSLHETEIRGTKVLLGDPMEAALVDMGRAALPDLPPSRSVDEISFDADRMRQSVVYEVHGDRILYCKGAPESLYPLCRHISDAGTLRPLDSVTRARIVEAQEEMAERGLRVLAFATRSLPSRCERSAFEQDMTFLGLVGLEDPPRGGDRKMPGRRNQGDHADGRPPADSAGDSTGNRLGVVARREGRDRQRASQSLRK
jgi:magnesium-transporting ATPase (P-type)